MGKTGEWLRKLIYVFVIFSLPIFTHAEDSRFMKSKKDNPNLLAFGIGAYNVLRSNSKYKTGLVQLEFKGPDFFGKKYIKIRSFAAIMENFQASFWLGGGVNFDIPLGRPLVVTLGFGPGLFFRGHGKNLGYPLEMRSSIELAYRFKSHARLGAQFYHLSNGSLSKRNPGTEALVFFYAIPL